MILIKIKGIMGLEHVTLSIAREAGLELTL